jgi:5-methylcytosine-specific restriction endonuclease McrA
MAPGCTSRRNLEDHHVVYRSRGGRNDLSNRICLCRFHHQRGEHGDLAACRGRAPLGLLWRLGKRKVATWYRNERRVAANRAPDGAGAGRVATLPRRC